MATKKKTEKKPTKPAKGKYVPPSSADWKTKPALLKLVQEHGKAAPAVHKLQHDLKQSRATIKKYAEAIGNAIWRFEQLGETGMVARLREELGS